MKKEYLLLVVVIIGLGALLFYQKKGQTNYQLPVLPVLQKSVDRVLIEKAGEKIEIRLHDGKWVVGEKAYRANSDRVKKIIAEVKAVKLEALISEKANYQIYDLEAEKRIKVSLFAADQLLRELQIGKNSASLRQTYVMLKDDPKVYQALGNLKSNVFSSVADLRDKKVFAIGADKLASIDEIVVDHLEDGKRQVIKLVKLKSEPVAGDQANDLPAAPVVTWRLASGASVASENVKKLFNSISDLQCENYIDNPHSEAFSSPLYKVVLKGGGEEFSLSLMAPEDNKYPALSSQSPEPFWLPGWRTKKIIKELAAFYGI